MEPTNSPVLDVFTPVIVSQVSENPQNIKVPEMSANVDVSACNPEKESLLPSMDNSIPQNAGASLVELTIDPFFLVLHLVSLNNLYLKIS